MGNDDTQSAGRNFLPTVGGESADLVPNIGENL
jgi:hypothetical protein